MNEHCPSNPVRTTTGVLVIGYGSTLHRDDAVGQRVAEAVEGWDLARVRAVAVVQLLPEHAEPIARSEHVIFVDAGRLGGPQALDERTIVPDRAAPLSPHSGDPRALLALAQALYGVCPSATMLVVPGSDFTLGEELSPVGQRGLEAALCRVRSIIEDRNARAHIE